VRIEFKMEGGIAHFPGLTRPVSINTDRLPEDARVELENLVKETRFFELPSSPGPRLKKGADYYRYRITIEAGGQSHTLNLADPVENPNLQRLVVILRKRAGESLSTVRKPGTGE
jgi:hypothetical protein